jgi:hypothetical protein
VERYLGVEHMDIWNGVQIREHMMTFHPHSP